MTKDDFLWFINRFLGILFGVLTVLFAVAVVLALMGCTQYRYITVPEYHYVDSTKMIYRADSVYLHDSIFSHVETRGDTVFLTKYVTKYKYKEKARVDTLIAIERDSVPRIVPVEKEVEVYKMTPWQTFFYRTGIILGFALLCYIVYWLVRKWR